MRSVEVHLCFFEVRGAMTPRLRTFKFGQFFWCYRVTLTRAKTLYSRASLSSRCMYTRVDGLPTTRSGSMIYIYIHIFFYINRDPIKCTSRTIEIYKTIPAFTIWYGEITLKYLPTCCLAYYFGVHCKRTKPTKTMIL